jgi:hypothetical protein
MIREGQTDLTLRYIAESPKRLAISNFTDGGFAPSTDIMQALLAIVALNCGLGGYYEAAS